MNYVNGLQMKEEEENERDEEGAVKFNEWMSEMDEWKRKIEEWRHECVEAMRERKPMPPMPPMASMPMHMPMPMQMPMMRHMRHMHHMHPFRSNVIASRIRDGELRSIDMLIEAGLFNTRSEAVAYLVGEGIKAKKDVFDKVSSTLQDIRRIRGEADAYLAKLKREVGLSQVEAQEGPERPGIKCPKCNRDLAGLPEDINVCPYCGSDHK